MLQSSAQAIVIDISVDKPTKDDIFFVDSNVWLWMTYSKITCSPAVDLEECLPILKKFMPYEDYQSLRIRKSPNYFLKIVSSSSKDEF